MNQSHQKLLWISNSCSLHNKPPRLRRFHRWHMQNQDKRVSGQSNALAALSGEIKTLVAEADSLTATADEKYVKAGLLLAELKSKKPTGVKWGPWVLDLTGLSRSRADQLIRIGRGSTTVAAERKRTAVSVANSKTKQKLAATSGHSLEAAVHLLLKLARADVALSETILSIAELNEIAAFFRKAAEDRSSRIKVPDRCQIQFAGSDKGRDDIGDIPPFLDRRPSRHSQAVTDLRG